MGYNFFYGYVCCIFGAVVIFSRFGCWFGVNGVVCSLGSTPSFFPYGSRADVSS